MNNSDSTGNSFKDQEILEERFKEMESEIIFMTKQVTNLSKSNPAWNWAIVSAIGVFGAIALTSTCEFKNGIPYYKTNPDAVISLIGGAGTIAATIYKFKLSAKN